MEAFRAADEQDEQVTGRRLRWAGGGVLALLLSATAGCAGIVVEVDPAPLSSMAPTCVVTGLKADGNLRRR